MNEKINFVFQLREISKKIIALFARLKNKTTDFALFCVIDKRRSKKKAF